MPRLPDIDSLGARPIPVSRRRVSSVRNAGALGAAAKDVGTTVSRAGERLDEIYDEDDVRRRDLEHIEEIRVIRAEARQAQGTAAKPALEQAQTKVKQLNERLIAAARSPRARRALESSILRRSGTELDSISEHALSESTKVMESSMAARRDAFLEEAQEAWDRPEVFEQNLASAQGEIAAWGKWKGLAPEAVALEQRAARYKARTAVAQRMISEGDYDGALAYANAHRADIGHEAENALRAAIRDPMEEEAAEALVANLTSIRGDEAPAPLPAPTVAALGENVVSRMQGITAVAESGNRERDSRGRLITSHAGAQGKMQVMSYTSRDPGYGVKPARDGSDEERTRVGRDYLAAMMRQYGNDPAKAWAAYNWGPGRVDTAIKRHGDSWLAHAPKETREYVNGNLAMLGRGAVGSAALTPTGRRVDYSAARAEIDALELPYDLKRKAVAALDRRVAAEDRVTNRNEDDATRAALEVVEKLGGGFTSMSQIPADIRMRMPVSTRISLAAQAQQNALPKPIPANGNAALTLTLQSINDPEGFKGADLRLYRSQVTPGEFEQLASTQARMRTEKPHASPTANLRSEIDGTIRFYARDVGLAVDSKATDREREQYLKVFNGMERHIQTITEGKRQPTDAELKAAFDRVTMQVTTEQGDKGRWFEVAEPGTRIRVEVPLPVQTRIVNAYQAAEGRVPTEAELMAEYLRNKGKPGYWN